MKIIIFAIYDSWVYWSAMKNTEDITKTEEGKTLYNAYMNGYYWELKKYMKETYKGYDIYIVEDGDIEHLKGEAIDD